VQLDTPPGRQVKRPTGKPVGKRPDSPSLAGREDSRWELDPEHGKPLNGLPIDSFYTQ